MTDKHRIVFIAGKKIDLVIPEKERHFEAAILFINDRRINRWLVSGAFPLDRQDEAKWFDQQDKDRNIRLMIEDKKGIILGSVGLHNIDWQQSRATLGIMIGRSERWGQGLATEAEHLMVRHAFSIGLRKVQADVYAPNIASAKALEKVGFKQEGTLRQHIFKNGQWHDVLVYGLLKEEFTG